MVSDPSSELQPTVRQPPIAPFPLGSQNTKDSSYNDVERGKFYSIEIFGKYQTKIADLLYSRFKMTVNK